ncbi:hypothetical protein, partial [Legionella rubrilucens]|uniref:hypothetical protein n=2 Tax=Legionella rubrilucens TaxID=458 RepID=UPI0013EFB803
AKAEQGDASFAPHFNQLFTAFTRATQSLAIVEDSSVHQRKNLLTPLKQTTLKLTQNTTNNNNNNNPEPKPIPASQQDWINEANKLKHLGKSEQAKAIEQQFTQRTVEQSANKQNTTLPLQKINQISKKAGKKPVPAPTIRELAPETLVMALVTAAKEKKVFNHERLANPAELEKIWLTIPIPTRKRHYSNLFIYSLHHYNKLKKALGSVSLDAIYKKLFTVKTLSLTVNTFGLERSLLHFLCDNNITATILHHQLKHTPALLEAIPTSLWIAKSAHGPVNTSLLFRLTLSCPDILELMVQTNKGEALEKIPLMEWFEEYTIAEGFLMTPWVSLMLNLFKANPDSQDIDGRAWVIYNKICFQSSSVPSFTPEQLCRENFLVISDETRYCITLLHALLFTREGCNLLKRWLDKNPESLAKIPLEFWLKETHLFNQTLTPLESLAIEGSPILERLLQQYPELPFKIKPEILYRQGHKGSMIQCLAADQNLHFLTRILTENPKLIAQIPANAWYHPDDVQETTPLYWLASTATGRPLFQFLLEQHPALINQIPPSVWHEKPGKPVANHHREKCVLLCLLQDPKSYKILDLLADKLIDSVSVDKWHKLIKPVIGDVLKYLGGDSQDGRVFFVKLANKLNDTLLKQGIPLKPLEELLFKNKKPPAETGSHSPQFFSPAPSSKEEEAPSKTMEWQNQ